MRIDTTRFGRIDVPDESLVIFPSGLVGLSRYTRFVVIEEERHPAFQWLQAVEEPGLAVVVIDANLIDLGLQVEVPDDAVSELDFREADPLGLYVIVTVPKDHPEQATVNLRGPIVMNLRTRRAKQLVLSEAWPIKYPLCPDSGSAQRSQEARATARPPMPEAPGRERAIPVE